MTDYKLVPVEPTPKMLQVWKSMYGYSRYDKYKAMLAAAPAVQGEPGVKWAPEEVANGNKGIRWVSDEGVHGRPTDHDCRVYLESNPNARGCHCPECTMLYAAPQPADQQPVCPTCPTCYGIGWYMDCQNEFRPASCPDCSGSGKAEHSITVQESDSAAPDVAGLVEALAKCGHQASYTIGCIEALQNQLNKIREIANEALAAHRKQGGGQ